MPSTIHTSVGSPWSDGSTVHGGGTSLPWGDGATIHAGPSSYTAGPPPSGGTPTGPMPGVALYTIAARATYDVPHTMEVTDLRDDEVLAVESVSMSCDEDSILWTLRASGGDALYSKLTAGEQPAQVKVDIDGELWVFVIDAVSRSRSFGQSSVTVSGRSPAVAAGSPYEADQNWVNDGISTGAQIAAVANLYTGLGVSWEIEDWLVPDRVFSFSGTPLAVVARVAEAVGAVVQADRTALGVRVMPRYPILANEWPTVAPDVEIALDAVLSEQYERSDRPEYTGIYLAGQQQGAVGFVRLAGTSGVNLHPLVTDLLLTEEPALRMRGTAILGASGGQAAMTLTLPLLTGAGEPGVLAKGQLVRVLDPAGAWDGLVRSVAVNATLPVVTQTVVLERHTKAIEGSVVVTPPPPPEAEYERYFFVAVYNGFTVGSEYGALGPGGLSYVSVGPSTTTHAPLWLSSETTTEYPREWSMGSVSAFGKWVLQPQLDMSNGLGSIAPHPRGTVVTGSTAREGSSPTLVQIGIAIPGIGGDSVWLRSNSFSGGSPTVGGSGKSFEFVVQIGPDEGTGDLYEIASDLVDASTTATVTASRMSLEDHAVYGVSPR